MAGDELRVGELQAAVVQRTSTDAECWRAEFDHLRDELLQWAQTLSEGRHHVTTAGEVARVLRQLASRSRLLATPEWPVVEPDEDLG